MQQVIIKTLETKGGEYSTEIIAITNAQCSHKNWSFNDQLQNKEAKKMPLKFEEKTFKSIVDQVHELVQ